MLCARNFDEQRAAGEIAFAAGHPEERIALQAGVGRGPGDRGRASQTPKAQ
ncbi:hypothetical protein [Catenuloplanes japonicus]|uniref:hypothetical protein n=1 Tax=Catenuloplanes japonicus TaxID=33876 RepID=UPI000ACDB3D5|nr:hypothetical protein [Catenuloplanes japonicus]